MLASWLSGGAGAPLKFLGLPYTTECGALAAGRAKKSETRGMGQAFAFLISAIVVAGAIFLSAPHYQIALGENQTVVWRLNTLSGELAVCTSPDLPGAGCRAVTEPKPKSSEPQTPSAAPGAAPR